VNEHNPWLPAKPARPYQFPTIKRPTPLSKTDQLIRQVSALTDGVTDAQEREWQHINSAENLGWIDKLTLMESGIRRFQKTLPSYEEILQAMLVCDALRSQGAYCPAAKLAEARAKLAELLERKDRRVRP
jgi:hypothetical protein